MKDKKELINNDLEKVSGGTYINDDYIKLYTMDEIKQFEIGFNNVQIYTKNEEGRLISKGQFYFKGLTNNGTAAIFTRYNSKYTVGDNDINFAGPIFN